MTSKNGNCNGKSNSNGKSNGNGYGYGNGKSNGYDWGRLWLGFGSVALLVFLAGAAGALVVAAYFFA
jgi:hypothetical protein